MAFFRICGVLLGWVLAAGCALAQAPFQAPPAPRFDIQRFVVEGNTLLPPEQVERIVAPHAGKSRDFGDVQRALEALQDAYLARGYSAARVLVPEQELARGEVRLQVVEARIRNLRVEGNQIFDRANVLASLPSLTLGESPNTDRIGRNVQLVNENPAKQVSIRLEATDERGKVDAVARVTEEKPVRYIASFDSSGNANTGYYRVGAGYVNANMFNRDHMLTLQAITSPSQVSDVTILAGGYRIPFYEWNGAIDLTVAYSNVNSGSVGGLLNVSGAGSVYGVRYSQILPRIEAYEHKLALGYDYRDYHQNITFGGGGPGLLPDITVKPLTLTYSGRYVRVGREINGFAAFSQNIPGGADGSQAAFSSNAQTGAANRPQARAAYNVWRFGAVWSEALPKDYLLRAAFNGQYSNDRLAPVEAFGMGGADSVRGFNERETASDKGHRLSVEGYSPDFGSHLGAAWRARGLAFVDVARGSDQDPVRGDKNGLASVGLGMRLNQGKALSFRVDWAHVMNAAGTRPLGKDKVFFALSYTFQ